MAAQGPSTNSNASIAATTPIKVKAAAGVRVPMEGAPRKYITDSGEVNVTRTAYYIRRLKDGDLILVVQPATKVSTPVPAAAPAAAPTAAPVQARGVASEA